MGVTTFDGKVKVYDVRMMKLQMLYSAHEGPMSQAAFHHNGRNHQTVRPDRGAPHLHATQPREGGAGGRVLSEGRVLLQVMV